MKRRTTSWMLVSATALAVAAALPGSTAIGAHRAQESPTTRMVSTASNVIIDGTTDSVTNIDPAGNYDYGSATVDLMLFEHLLDFKKPGTTPQPSLASSCGFVGETLTTYTCTIRSGVKFQNGDPLTAEDVKWSFDRVKKIHDPSGIDFLIDNLRSTTTSGNKVTFHLKKPQSTWPLILTTGAGSIVPKSVYPADKILPNDQTQVGTGPYQLVKYTPGQQAVFKSYSSYWGPKAKTENLIINYYTKSSTMKLALQRGEIDMVFREFTPTELQSLKTASGLKIHQGNGVSIRYMVLNVKRPPTNNIGVRKAIAYLMPRQTIATRVYHGLVTPLYSMVPAGMAGHTDAFATVYGRSPNVAKAKAALQAAGVQTPVPLTVWWTPSHYGDASADEYAEIQRALNASGLFKVTLKSAEWAQYSDALGRQYNAFQLGWFPDYPDPEDYLIPFYAKGNFTINEYTTPAMEALLTKEQGAKNNAARLGFVRQAQALAAKDVPTIPYWQGTMIAVSKTSVQGIDATLDPTYIMRFWNLTKS
jgi:peptide/nickel transport system substrate-binding protein